MSESSPPRWMEALLEVGARGLPASETVVGDLAEGYRVRCGCSGRVRANLWYFGEMLSLPLHRIGSALRSLGSGGGGLEPVGRDLAWAARSVARRPWFGLGVTAILSLAVAATTSAVSLVAGTYRAASWWAEGERTVTLWPGRGMSLGNLLSLRQESDVLGEVGAWTVQTSSISDEDRLPESVPSAVLSPNLFSVLSVQPALGRGLVTEDETVGAEPVVVIGHALWRTAFGADPEVVGRLVEVDGVRRRVVGVQGPGGTAPGVGTQLWIPVVMNAFDEDFWPRQDYELVAGLPEGVSIETARVELVRVMQILAQRFSFFYQPDFGLDATVAPANEPVWAPLRTPLVLLMGGSLLLLLVAAIDLGNLFLGRSLERAGELRVRAVLGAGRGRLVGQLLVEGLVWTAAGVTLGSVAGLTLAGRLSQIFPVGSQVVSGGMSRELLAFTVATGLLVWALMSGVPIVHFLRDTRGGLAPRRFRGHRAQGVLVVTQAALATALLVSAGLLVRSVGNLSRIPVGFDGTDAVALEVAPNGIASEGDLTSFYDALVDATARGEGVRAVGLASALPLRDPVPPSPINRLELPTEVAAAPRAFRHVVDPGYFEALRVRVLRGRGIERTDRAATEPVVVVNATMAELLWPGENPLGRRIAVDPHGWDAFLTVVGVVDDVRFQDLTRAVPPAYYVPFAQDPVRVMYVVTAAPRGLAAAADLVREAVASLDADTPVGGPLAVDRLVSDAYGAVRIMMSLIVVLAVLATGLGAVGLYGSLASYVTRHRVELSTRMALGAQPHRVFRGVVGVGLGLTGAGILAGSVLAAFAGGWVRSLLYGVSPLDPASFGIPAACLALIGLIAAAIPAGRAATVAPADVLREG